eukprot:scaffold1449_cov324-Prasinococcus_capsulatus_cf.AAC.9
MAKGLYLQVARQVGPLPVEDEWVASVAESLPEFDRILFFEDLLTKTPYGDAATLASLLDLPHDYHHQVHPSALA